MGEPALRVLNGLDIPLSRPIEPREGEIQAFTPTIDALYTPDIDDSLDEEGAKQRFWRAFRMLGRLVRRAAALLSRRGRPSARGVKTSETPAGRRAVAALSASRCCASHAVADADLRLAADGYPVSLA